MFNKRTKGELDYLSYSYNEFMTFYNLYTDAYFGYLCYLEVGKSELLQDKIKYTLIFATIFISIASQYFIYYSSYMKLILFQNSYENWEELSLWEKIFMCSNLIFTGAFRFPLFDIINKTMATFFLVSFLVYPFKGLALHKHIQTAYYSLMLSVFKLDPENIKVFESMKKIVVPIFEDVPIILV